MATDLFSKARNGKQDRLFLEKVFRSETKTSRKGPKGGILGNLENLDIDIPLKPVTRNNTIIQEDLSESDIGNNLTTDIERSDDHFRLVNVPSV